jgi:hypothetical protein
MKIAKREKDFLILRDNNVSGFLFGVLIAAIGAYAILAQMGKTDIVGILFGSALILVGAYLFAKAKTTTIKINKADTTSFSSWSILKREKLEVPNSKIAEIRLEKSLEIWPTSYTYYSYPIVFVLKDGKALSFEFGAMDIGMDLLSFANNRKGEGVRSVAEFLGVPFNGERFADLDDMARVAEYEIGKRIKKGK